jgi:hypothetical protein
MRNAVSHLFISFLNADLVESCNNIQFGIPFCLADIVQGLTDKRKGISIFLGNSIEGTVVNTHA